MTIHCNRQWWSPQESILAAASFLLFFVLSALTLFHFMSAIFEGPGYLALKWMPVFINLVLLYLVIKELRYYLELYKLSYILIKIENFINRFET